MTRKEIIKEAIGVFALAILGIVIAIIMFSL